MSGHKYKVSKSRIIRHYACMVIVSRERPGVVVSLSDYISKDQGRYPGGHLFLNACFSYLAFKC